MGVLGFAAKDDRGRPNDQSPRLGKYVGDITFVWHGHKEHLGARLSNRKHLLLRLFEGSEDPRNARMGIADESGIEIGPRNRLVHRPPDRERHGHDQRTLVLALV